MASLSVAQGPCSAVLPTVHDCHYAFQKFPFFCVTLYFTKYIYRPSTLSPLCFITAVQRLSKPCIPVRTPSLLMDLITRVTSLDTSSMFLKRFPRNSFFNFGKKSKVGGLMSGLYGRWGSTCHPYFSKISHTASEAWGRALMYDRWSLREIWLQPVSSSISRLRFAEQGPRGLPIRTLCSLLKSGSQLSRKSEWLEYPTGRASAVCRTFEMTFVYISCVKPDYGLFGRTM